MKLWLLWVLATTVAFGLGGRLGVALSPSRDLIVTGYTALTASIVLAGVLQWPLLRRLIADTSSWVLTSVAAVAVPVVGLVSWVTGAPVDTPVGGLLRWLAFGAGYGGVTATALLLLMRQRLESAMP